MTGTIEYIGPETPSRFEGSYQLVTIKLQNGRRVSTYLCPHHRNFARWKPFLRVGVTLDGLRLTPKGLVDADSMIEAAQPQLPF
jgi:hypothetical protein